MAHIARRDDRAGMPTFLGWDPFRLMNEMMHWDPFQGWGGLGATGISIAAEVHEDDDRYHIAVDMPGVAEKDLELTVRGSDITIAGKREARHERSEGTFYAMERQYGAFSRTFRLPPGIDTEHVEAELKDGVLTIEVPKRPEAKPRKVSLKGLLNKVKSLGSGEGSDDDKPK